ncbi:hypothetical protein G6F31_021614 [Rhizopus arrhizus]|nr:hypothetical protein G6F31_021614 [Rhizopus arrhizus]
MGVQPDLALVDDRHLVLVQVLDRVLDGEDVPGGGAVAVVDHRRQRGGLARAAPAAGAAPRCSGCGCGWRG